MEAGILIALQSARASGLSQLMALLSALGNDAFIWLVLAVVMLFFAEKRQTGVIVLVAVIAASLLCELVIGPLVGRVRPCDAGIGVSAVIGVSHSGFSFPSAHAATSFAAATVIAMTLGRRFGTPAVVGAALISFSRLFLGVNYPSDVIAGCILGVVAGIVLVWAYNTFFRGAVLERVGTPRQNARKSVSAGRRGR